MTKNFNVEPYYDDYSEDNKHYRILFRPGYAVQARELTQLQTLLQKQVERLGSHLFKDGTMVIPGQIAYDTKLKYVKLTAKYGSGSNAVDTASFISGLVGKEIVGATSGVRAQIVQVAKATSADPNMLFVKYIGSGTDTEQDIAEGEQVLFLAGETLTTVEPSSFDEISMQVQTTNTTINPAFGESAGASIARGVYYIKGFFVLVEAQTIVLSKFTKTPTVKVGLKIVESIVTPEEDETLLDNAQSSYNYAAPGAHRYFIDAILTSRSITSTDSEDFIQLLRLKSGRIEYMVNRSEYAVLEDNMARRTFDESGNYTVRQFGIDLREYRDNNRGSWSANTAYLLGDIVLYNKQYYVAKKSGISSSVSNVTLDTNVTWEVVAKPQFNRGIYTAPKTVQKPVLDSNGDIMFNYDSEGRIESQIFETVNATVADHQELEAKLAVGMEPGKAYVFGYEIEKLGTTYVPVDKARDTDDETDVLFAPVYGNYVVVNNVNFAPNVTAFPTVDIYNRYTDDAGHIPTGAVKVGTARVRGFELHSGSGADAYYKMFLFDVNMLVNPNSPQGHKYSFNYHAKQFRIAGVNTSTYADSFTADAAVIPEALTGAITFTTGSPTTTIIGVNTKFLTELNVGDFIYLDNAPRRISSISSNTSLTISTSVGSQSSEDVLKCSSLLQEADKLPLIFELPKFAIKTVSEVNYKIARSYANVQAGTSNGDGTCNVIISTSGGNEFADASIGNYALYSAYDGAAIAITPSSITRSSDRLSVTFKVDDSYASTYFTVFGTIQKERALGLKSKTITTATTTFTTAATAQAKTIYLGKADGLRIKSIKMKSGTFASPTGDYTIDITSRYSFSGGQTASYYGIASISLKDKEALPAAPIQVVYDYFEHGTGDFFTADSYPNYKDVPRFGKFNLRDCIDFRPRVDDSTTGAVVFTGENDFLPKYGQDFIISYEYYLPRASKISINKSGEFRVVNGSSSLTPNEPSDPTDGMVLYKLQLQPFTFNANSEAILVTPIENKRYTMRDIGKIEQRVNQLEYYTSLSLLEQETKNLTIKDDDGLDRYKNGFIVDNFTSQTIGDTESADYMCSIDMENGVLRPFYSMSNVDFVETYSNNTQRSTGGSYQLTGDVITLPYTHLSIISQPRASTTENVNPFAVFTFIGRCTLTPPYDRWFEVKRRPDIVTNVEGNYNAIKTLATKAGVLGTVWNAWQTQWTGASTKSTKKTALQGFSTFQSGLINSDFWRARSTFSQEDGDLIGWTPGGRVITSEVTATQVGQSRTGVKTSIKEVITKTTVEDKVLSVATIPYIRSRSILVQAKGLKPNTRFYPYFDKKDVAAYCQQADKIVILKGTVSGVVKGNNIEFNDDSTGEPIVNVGNDYKNSARAIGATPDFALNVGDVITGATSGATAVVVGRENVITNGVITGRAIFVVNVKDSKTADGVGFTAGELITGSVSGATATVVSHTKSALGAELKTNNNGDVNFLFTIPNKAGMQFRTGKRELSLLDVSTYDMLKSNSSMTAEYAAEGFLEERQASVRAVRNAEIVQERVTENRTIIQTSERTIGDTGWYDPLAQTFLVNAYPDGAPTGNVSAGVQGDGCFITKVDVFFATKDDSLPITLQVREVVNGYPGRTVLPFSQVVLNPDKVKTSSDSSVATTFTFPSPVYVQNATEYCIVLLTNSVKYKVWISQLGQADKLTGNMIDQQPYAGVLFKSQNASTWTAEQMQDLKFNIYRAKFTTGKLGRVEFENSIVQDEYLEENPLYFTAGSNKVRVNMHDHGMTVGSKVTLRVPTTAATGSISVTKGSTTVTGSGSTFMSDMMAETAVYRPDGTLIGVFSAVSGETGATLSAAAPMTYSGAFTYANPVNGIKPINLYKTHDVTAVEEFDNFIITLSENATQTGYAGGDELKASRNIQFDAIQPFVTHQSFTNTKVISYFLGITGKSIDGTQTAYLTPADTQRGWLPVELNETNELPVTHMIASEDNTKVSPYSGNEIDLSSKSGQNNTAIIRTDIYTDIDTLSPVIDARSVSAILINNKINNPSTAMNIDPIDNRAIITNASDITLKTAITHIQRVGTSVTVTAADHGFVAGQSVRIAAVTNTEINGSGVVTVADTNTFTYTFTGVGTDFNSDDTGYVFGGVIKIGNTGDNRAHVATLYSGQYVTITGVNEYSEVSGDNVVTAMITDVSADGSYFVINQVVKAGTGNTISITSKDRFFDEITPFGSSTYSKYVTKRISLQNPSTFLKIRFAASLPTAANIGVYYKLGIVGSVEDFSTVEYRKATATYQKSNDGLFKEVEIDIPNLPSFDAVALKLTMTSIDSTKVPEIKELRIIACA